MWTKYFNRIFVINLPENTERLRRTTEHLNNKGINFQVVPGIKNIDGEQGIMDTLLGIWKSCSHLDRILIFEDDVKFVVNPNLVMDRCINQLQKTDWHMFYLGPNTHQNFTEFSQPNLLPLVASGYGLHAVAYSKAGIKEILRCGVTKPVDVSLAERIQPLGKTYASYPLIATQHNGFSNIQQKEMNQGYIEQKFYQHVKHLV